MFRALCCCGNPGRGDHSDRPEKSDHSDRNQIQSRDHTDNGPVLDLGIRSDCRPSDHAADNEDKACHVVCVEYQDGGEQSGHDHSGNLEQTVHDICERNDFGDQTDHTCDGDHEQTNPVDLGEHKQNHNCCRSWSSFFSGDVNKPDVEVKLDQFCGQSVQ